MNVIVIAALVLIVMVILAVVMGGKFRIFATTTRNCQAQGGQCLGENDGAKIVETSETFSSCPELHTKLGGTDCWNEEAAKKAICCIPLIEEKESPLSTVGKSGTG